MPTPESSHPDLFSKIRSKCECGVRKQSSGGPHLVFPEHGAARRHRLFAAVLGEGPAPLDERLAVAAAPVRVVDVMDLRPPPAGLMSRTILGAGARAFGVAVGVRVPGARRQHDPHQQTNERIAREATSISIPVAWRSSEGLRGDRLS